MGWGQGSPSSVIINNCWKKWKLYSNWICHEGLCQASTLIGFLASKKSLKSQKSLGCWAQFSPRFLFFSFNSLSFFFSIGRSCLQSPWAWVNDWKKLGKRKLTFAKVNFAHRYPGLMVQLTEVLKVEDVSFLKVPTRYKWIWSADLAWFELVRSFDLFSFEQISQCRWAR